MHVQEGVPASQLQAGLLQGGDSDRAKVLQDRGGGHASASCVPICYPQRGSPPRGPLQRTLINSLKEMGEWQDRREMETDT
eukprot:4166315-Amphidinium_carterae.1